MNDEAVYEKDLLDYFAAKALGEFLRDDLTKEIDKQMGYAWACKWAYIVADEMMKARNAHNSTKTA